MGGEPHLFFLCIALGSPFLRMALPPTTFNWGDKMNLTFADSVAQLLIDNPEGLSSYDIFNKLADSKTPRWLPTRNSIGSKLKAIGGVQKIGKSTGFSAMTSRRVALWVIDIDKFNRWRYK